MPPSPSPSPLTFSTRDSFTSTSVVEIYLVILVYYKRSWFKKRKAFKTLSYLKKEGKILYKNAVFKPFCHFEVACGVNACGQGKGVSSVEGLLNYVASDRYAHILCLSFSFSFSNLWGRNGGWGFWTTSVLSSAGCWPSIVWEVPDGNQFSYLSPEINCLKLE